MISYDICLSLTSLSIPIDVLMIALDMIIIHPLALLLILLACRRLPAAGIIREGLENPFDQMPSGNNTVSVCPTWGASFHL